MPKSELRCVAPTEHRSHAWLLGAALIIGLGSVVSIARGADSNFDLLNVRAFIGWRFWHPGTQAFFPGGAFSNIPPYLDALLWPLWSGVPWPIAAALVGAAQASGAVAVYILARRWLPTSMPLHEPICWAVAALSLLSPIVLSQFGTALHDLLLTSIFLWGLVLSTTKSQLGAAHLLGGFLIGASLVMKYTQAPFVLLALAALPLAVRSRPQILRIWAGALLAVALLLLPYFALTWRATGNPIFPLFNSVFRSPLYPTLNFRDVRWNVGSPGELAERLVSPYSSPPLDLELAYFDPRMTLTFVMVIAACAIAVFTVVPTRRGESSHEGLATIRLLYPVAMCSLGYLISLLLWGYGRYYTTALALAPLAGVAAIELTRLPRRLLNMVTWTFLIGLVAVVAVPLLSIRHSSLALVDWRHREPPLAEAIVPSIQAPPRVQDADTVLFASVETSYLASAWSLADKALVGLPSLEPAAREVAMSLVGMGQGVAVYSSPWERQALDLALALGVSLSNCEPVTRSGFDEVVLCDVALTQALQE